MCKAAQLIQFMPTIQQEYINNQDNNYESTLCGF